MSPLVGADPGRRTVAVATPGDRPATAAAARSRAATIVERPPAPPVGEVRSAIAAPAGSRVMLWGDSLSSQAEQPFRDAIRFWTGGRVEVTASDYGGTATCDWLANMVIAASQGPIVAAVVEFSGNALTECMAGPGGRPLAGDAYLARYRETTITAIDTLRAAGARVYLVGTPASPTSVPGDDAARLRSMYEQLAAERDGVFFVDAGAAVLGPHGEWTATLPCLAEEGAAQGCVDGRIPVRAPDGVHFCPGDGPALRGVTGDCPRWSSGAIRFGRAMAEPVLEDLRIQEPAPTGQRDSVGFGAGVARAARPAGARAGSQPGSASWSKSSEHELMQ